MNFFRSLNKEQWTALVAVGLSCLFLLFGFGGGSAPASELPKNAAEEPYVALKPRYVELPDEKFERYYTGKKIFNMTVALGLSVVGLAGYLISGSLLFSVIDLSLALVGITAARGIFWAIPPRILTGLGAAGGIAFINSIGTAGGAVGPVMMGVFKDATGGFTYGIMAMAGVMVVTTALAASLKLLVRQE